MWKETTWKKADAMSSQPTPTMAMYTEAMDKFTKSATAFMEHVHLLNEARMRTRKPSRLAPRYAEAWTPVTKPCDPL